MTRRLMRLTDRVAANALAQLIAQVVTAAASIVGLAVTTRYLSVAQFGEIQAALALVTMFAFMGDLGLSTIGARTLARAPAHRTDAVTAALFTASCLFTVGLLAAAVGVALLAYHGSRELAREATLIMLVPLLLTPWATVARAHAVWRQRTYVVSAVTLLARLVSVAAIIGAAALAAGPTAIAIAYALGTGLSALGVIWWQRRLLPGLAPQRGGEARALAIAGLSLSVITVINAVYFRLDAFLLSILSTPRSVALYTLAYRVLDSVLVLPGYLIVTLVPELARLHPASPRSRRIVDQALMAVWLLVMPLGAAVVIAPQAALALGGGRYRAAGAVLSLLLPSVMLASLNSVLGGAMVAQARQRALIAVSTANLLINGALNVILIPALGARGAAIALLATEIVSLAATVAVYRRGAGMPAPPRWRRSLVAGCACAAAMCARFAVSDADRHVALTLVVGLVPAAVVYAIAVWALRVAPEPLRALAQRRLRRTASTATASPGGPR